MNAIAMLPMQTRLTALFVFGMALGAIANLAIYRLAWFSRAISPWGPLPPTAPRRRFLDRLPILGWFGLRREAAMHGTGFWVRPMLLELFAGVGVAALYWYEVVQLGLHQQVLQNLPGVLVSATTLHVQFACHVALFWLMLVASMIDVDERTIPDSITVSGTLLGLTVATLNPWTLLPVVWWEVPCPGFLHVASPAPRPAGLGGFPAVLIALACWCLWCVGLLPRTWHSRHGWRRAFQLMMARILRTSTTPWIGLMAILGAVAILAVWAFGGLTWLGLFSSLVGMAAGGGLIWIVRIVGQAVLRQEAMGFGDVTLMAMIGAFVGWQGCLIVFFLAPVAGVVIGLLSLIIHRESAIPYGPFLCLAAVVTIAAWPVLWNHVEVVLLALGFVIPAIIVLMLFAMAPLLWVVHQIRLLIFPDKD